MLTHRQQQQHPSPTPGFVPSDPNQQVRYTLRGRWNFHQDQLTVQQRQCDTDDGEAATALCRAVPITWRLQEVTRQETQFTGLVGDGSVELPTHVYLFKVEGSAD